jgi:Heterokaryon incompatibility protein (HET)
VDFGLFRRWLQLCETSHEGECKQPGPMSREVRKIRLVDVRNGQIIDSTTNERFVALSYVWGPRQQFCLKKDNYRHLQRAHGLKYDQMPTTIKDAFDVVDKIGERYIWIDRLCILLNDEKDKMDQMSNMDQIYSAAILTIVTANACCSNANIPGAQSDTRRITQHSAIIRGVHYVTTQPDLFSVMRELNWSTRGWTFQEGFLSSRCLVFTPSQAYFQCKSKIYCEDSCWIGSSLRVTPPPSIGNPICHLRDYTGFASRCNFNQYSDAVEGYSSRKLTIETDGLWAFSGIAKAFHGRF